MSLRALNQAFFFSSKLAYKRITIENLNYKLYFKKFVKISLEEMIF